MSNNYDWLECIPSGWKELARKMIAECEYIDSSYEIDDLKEKWGRLTVYSRWNYYCNCDLYAIEHKYEELSSKTCCKCGKPAVKISTGWILPFCDQCGTEPENNYKRFLII